MELYYKRVESVRKGRTTARTQTVVVFLPDVRSCLPTRFEWDELTLKYKKRLEMKLQSDRSGSVDRETIDRVDKKSHSTSIAQDESEAVNKDECEGSGSGNGGAGDDDIEMADETINTLEKESRVTDGDKAADSMDATKTTGGESSGDTEATSSSAISKALHTNIITNNITFEFFFRCSVFSLFFQIFRTSISYGRN